MGHDLIGDSVHGINNDESVNLDILNATFLGNHLNAGGGDSTGFLDSLVTNTEFSFRYISILLMIYFMHFRP